MEEKISVDPEMLKQQYAQCAVELGDRQFKIQFLNTEMQGLISRMFQLNTELGLVQSSKEPPPASL